MYFGYKGGNFMNYGRSNTSKRRKKIQSRVSMKKKKIRLRSFRVFLLVCLVLGIIVLGGVGILFKKIIDDTPQITANDLKPSAYTTTVYANDGETITGTFVSAGSNRVFTTLDKIPKDMQNAFIAVEDSRFYDHKGIDIKGITRAAVKGITSGGKFSQGGSTITQQLIKNSVFPNFSKETRLQKIERKIQELYLAIQVEKIVEKDEILENYLNTINMGQNTLGVQAAAKRYFGKDVSELTLSESATLAAITKSPSGYNPITNPEANAKRREKVLKDMLAQKKIKQDDYDTAMADTTSVYERIQTANSEYQESLTVNSYFVDEVAKEVMRDLQSKLGYSETQAQNAVYSGGLKIITTQDLKMQKICDEEMNNDKNYPKGIDWTVTGAISIVHQDGTQKHYDSTTFGKYVSEEYKKQYGKELEYPTTFSSQEKANDAVDKYIATLKSDPNDTVYSTITLTPQPQATVVVMDQHNGYVKAMVGGRGEKTGNMSLNRATQSTRQPGSTYKILSTYVPALDMNNDTLASVIEDAPFNYKNGRPVNNWWGGYYGNMTIRKCIEQSANVCSVKKYTEITSEVGLQYLTNNFKFTTLDPVDDSGQATALGGLTNGVYNIELTAAYASIANKGVYTEPILYTHIYDNNGNLLYENTAATHTAMKDSTAALITSAMEDVVKYGTGGTARLSNMTCAGKTGTTTDTRDLWFSGFTPYLTASVWSGYDDNQEISGSSSYHKTLWKKIMQRIHDTNKFKSVAFEIPESVTQRTICTQTGLLASSDACSKHTEMFAEGTVPKKSCPGHAPAPAPDGTAPAPGTTPEGGATTTTPATTPTPAPTQ
jgi:penicillin-binding protein 1A